MFEYNDNISNQEYEACNNTYKRYLDTMRKVYGDIFKECDICTHKNKCDGSYNNCETNGRFQLDLEEII